MPERCHDLVVALMDLLLGWVFRLPSDAQIFVVAIGSAFLLTAVRFRVSDQDLLRRCRQDKSRLKMLLREARERKDRAAVNRHRTTLGMIAMKQLRQEGRPLLVSLLPIALLATWSFERFEFHPLTAGDPIEFAAYFPASAVGKIAHIAPADGLTAGNGWIQEIDATTDQGPARGVAAWRLIAEARPEPHRIRVRFENRTFEHPISVGTLTSGRPLKMHDENLLVTEVKMRPVKVLGFITGMPGISLPAWLVAYLFIVIPSVLILKAALKIH